MGATQKKGNLGLVKAITDLTEKDIAVSLPISESERYDLIAEKNNICKTVQVRYTGLHNGRIEIKLKSVWTNSEGYQVRNRQQNDFDILAIYCPDTQKNYYLDASQFKNGNSITLRVEKPKVKNNRIRIADDYLEIKYLFKGTSHVR